MSQKKKKRTQAAHNLIESLLDDKTPNPFSKSIDGSAAVRFADSDPKAHEKLELEGGSVSKGFDAAKVTRTAEAARPERVKDLIDIDELTSPAKASLKSVSSAADAGESEKTVSLEQHVRRVSEPETAATMPEGASLRPRDERSETRGTKAEPSTIDRQGITELKTVVKMRAQGEKSPAAKPQQRPSNLNQGQGSPMFTSAEAGLKQAESLRIAQGRITELELELERLRRENEQLASAGQTLGRRSDELTSKVESLEQQSKESGRIHDEEKKVFRGQLQAKERENLELRARLEEMEGRLESNFKKIRVRERELEHRLEIVRMESMTLANAKDKTILELKRQLDQLTHENDYGKQKSQELYNQYKDKQETVRRVVRALRIALTILEGDEKKE